MFHYRSANLQASEATKNRFSMDRNDAYHSWPITSDEGTYTAKNEWLF